jgi:uncharacterized phage infection (PIP) family protein YhgE
MADVIAKCQYAGDPNDEYCKFCNGVTMLVDGTELSCTECTAYSPVSEEEIPNKVDEPLPANDPTDDKEEDASETSQVAQNDVSDVETEDSASEVTETTTSETTDAPEHTDAKVSYDKLEKEEKLLPDGVTVQALRYMSGCTLIKTEPNGKESYYKFSAEEEWAVDEATGSDTEKMDSIREALWDKLNFEIDSQIEELFDEA